MAKRKRTAAQMSLDLVEIETLSLQGKTLHQIAKTISADRDYDLSPQQIQYDMKKLKAIWEKESAAEISIEKGKALAEIRILQREYWVAWKDSCKDAETIRQEAADKEVQKVVKTAKGQSGDPRFLAGIQWCINKRCQILGLDAPKKIDHSGELQVKGYAEVSPDDWDNENYSGI